MKTSTTLLLVVLVAGVTVFLLQKRPPPAPEPAAVAPGSAGTPPPLTAEASRPDSRPGAGDEARPGLPAASSLQTSAELVAQLITGIRDALASSDPARHELAITQLLPALVLENPSEAARLAEAVEDPELRVEVLPLVARLWAAKDPAAAAAWAAALTAESERETALVEVSTEVATTDPATAVQILTTYGREGELNAPLETAVQTWAQKDFPAALAWSLGRQPDARRDALLARLAFVQAHAEPEAAATLATTHMLPGEAQNEAIISVLHQWAQRDLSAAAAWVKRFPEGPLRERAQGEIDALITQATPQPAP